jgi:calcineurin-like phosphoesterase family protein
MIYFISDLHIGHKGSLKWPNGNARDFPDINTMNQTIIDNWNSIVTDNDTVYLLGDVAYKCSSSIIKHVLNSLNGKIILIEGNHDKDVLKVNQQIHRFESVHSRLILNIDDLVIVLDHYPIEEWFMKTKGSIHLHGHTHGSIQDKNIGIKRYDVSVEVNNYTPISLEQIKEIMK